MVLEIEIFADDEIGDGKRAQAKFLVRGSDDVYWTDDPEQAVSVLRDDIRKVTGK